MTVNKEAIRARIEAQEELIVGLYRDDGLCCAIGALLSPATLDKLDEYGLRCDVHMNWPVIGPELRAYGLSKAQAQRLQTANDESDGSKRAVLTVLEKMK